MYRILHTLKPAAILIKYFIAGLLIFHTSLIEAQVEDIVNQQSQGKMLPIRKSQLEEIEGFIKELIPRLDTINEWLDKDFPKDLKFKITGVEYFFCCEDNLGLKQTPFYDAKIIQTLHLLDTVIVPHINGRPFVIIRANDSPGGEYNCLCLFNNRIGFFTNNSCINKSEIVRSPNPDFYMYNGSHKILVARDYKAFIRLTDGDLLWSENSEKIIYDIPTYDNEKRKSCNGIFLFDIRMWKKNRIAYGYSPQLGNKEENIYFWSDKNLEDQHQALCSIDLKTGYTNIIYEIPDSLTFWATGSDDYWLSKIQIDTKNEKERIIFKLFERKEYNHGDAKCEISIDGKGNILELKKYNNNGERID